MSGFDWSAWVSQHDVSLPESEPTPAEMVESCKANRAEALRRWKHAHRWVTSLKRDAGGANLDPKNADHVRALCEQARAKADTEHWTRLADYYTRELAAEIAAAAAQAKAAGDRVPGEDDGDDNGE